MLNPNQYNIQDMIHTPCSLDGKHYNHQVAICVSICECFRSLTSSARSSYSWLTERRPGEQTCSQVSFAPGSVVWAGSHGGWAAVAQALVSAAGAEPDLMHLLSGAPLFALDGREGAPRFPWRV